MSGTARSRVSVPDTRLRSTGVLIIGLLAAACGFQEEPTWSEAEYVEIYAAALGSLHRVAGSPDTLFVDPRPRMLIETGRDAFEMGDFNRFGDDAFSRAVSGSPEVAHCRTGPMTGCSAEDHPRFAVVSEARATGPRDAALLALHLDDRAARVVRDFRIQLRFVRGEWQVVEIADGS
ncbi:MAG: hypothetical protein WDZ89_00075 [Gemmatimonadota bacterium]